MGATVDLFYRKELPLRFVIIPNVLTEQVSFRSHGYRGDLFICLMLSEKFAVALLSKSYY